MTSLRVAEVGVTQQALISGQVINALTGHGVGNSFSVDVDMRLPAMSEFQPVKMKQKISAGGYFVFYANPVDVLPLNLAVDDSVEIRIAINAPGYTSAEEIVVVDGASITPSDVAVDMVGEVFELPLIDAPLLHRVISLQPVAVGVQGVVIEDNDLENPVAGASVQVIAPDVLPAVSTDSSGRYRIENLPVVESVTIRAELSLETSSVDHVIDYSTPLNIRIISLNG